MFVVFDLATISDIQMFSLFDFLMTRAISALIYNVLKAFMEMNSALFDELAASYKSERQR